MTESARHVEVIYCDDIRMEMGQKISLMGIYTGDMNVSIFPATLPKLCIAVTAITNADDPFQRLNVKITKGEDRAEIVSTGEVDIPAMPPKDAAENGTKLHQAQFHFVLSPLQLDGPTILRVAIETERGVIRGRGIRILSNDAKIEGKAPSPIDRRDKPSSGAKSLSRAKKKVPR